MYPSPVCICTLLTKKVKTIPCFDALVFLAGSESVKEEVVQSVTVASDESAATFDKQALKPARVEASGVGEEGEPTDGPLGLLPAASLTGPPGSPAKAAAGLAVPGPDAELLGAAVLDLPPAPTTSPALRMVSPSLRAEDIDLVICPEAPVQVSAAEVGALVLEDMEADPQAESSLAPLLEVSGCGLVLTPVTAAVASKALSPPTRGLPSRHPCVPAAAQLAEVLSASFYFSIEIEVNCSGVNFWTVCHLIDGRQ